MTQWKLFAANYNPEALWAYDALADWLAERHVAFAKANCANDHELIEQAADADIFIAYKYRVSRDVIAALPRLRVLMSSGSGYDHIDVQAATERGILVTNAARHNTEDVAEHALALMLTCARKLVLIQDRVREGAWRPPVQPVFRLRGKTLGLIGFGNIARALAWRAKGIGMRVIASSRSVSPDDVRAHGVEPVSKETLLSESDFVSLHLVSNETTRGTFGEAELRAMKPTAYLLNVSRGDLLDEAALIRALRDGWIAGAGLDVLETEPPDSAHPLRSMPNVVNSGHSAGSTVEAPRDWLNEWFETLNDVLNGTMPLSVVNPGVQPRLDLNPRESMRS